VARARMPGVFFDLAARLRPPEQPVGSEGGRPPVSHRVVPNGLWFVLATGCRREDVTPELGCSGLAARRYLRRWEGLGVWDRLHADLLRLLRQRPGSAPTGNVPGR
jgi:transposase